MKAELHTRNVITSGIQSKFPIDLHIAAERTRSCSMNRLLCFNSHYSCGKTAVVPDAIIVLPQINF